MGSVLGYRGDVQLRASARLITMRWILLVPSKIGKSPRTELSPTYDAGKGAHTGVVGVQLLANPARPPNAAGCLPLVATSAEAPARNKYDETN